MAKQKPSVDQSVRLQKYIADCGVTSRRKAETMITMGRVSVNNHVVTVLGTKINPEVDAILVDGKTITSMGSDKMYVLLHKPRCVMTTVSDPEGRDTVMKYCGQITERIYPVGRLDYLAEGFLLLTNDGEVANWMMHPPGNLPKTYQVKVFGAVTEALLERLRHGVKLADGLLRPAIVRVIEQLPGKTWLEIVFEEGRNRDIRSFCEGVGMTVDKLRHEAVGGLSIEGIAPGNFVILTKKELLSAMGVDNTGLPLKGMKPYCSNKKTIALYKKGAQPTTPADYVGFRKFRKDTYFQTIQAIKEQKAITEEAARTGAPIKKGPVIKPVVREKRS